MSKLEDLHPQVALRGILPDCAVTVVNVQWFGSDALELTYKDPAGRVPVAVARETMEVAALIGREVNVTQYTPDQLRARARSGVRFTRTILDGPKQWVVGGERQLEAVLG